MKRTMEGEPKPLSRDDLERYLKSIKFDERSEQGTLSDRELEEILRDNLLKYFQGKVTQDFIIGLGSAIYEECPENDTLLTVTCMIVDIHFPHLGKLPVEEIFRSALNLLK